MITSACIAAVSSQSAAQQHQISVTLPTGYGTTYTKIIRYATTPVANEGTAITYAVSDALGSSFTINESGLYSVTATMWYDTADGGSGLSVNSSELNVPIYNITAANRLGNIGGPQYTTHIMPWMGYLTAGDVVRVHNDGQGSIAIPGINKCTIIKLA